MPEQELTDLRIAGEDITLTEQGDLDLVNGFDNVVQSVALDVRDVTHFEIGNQLTELNIYNVKDAIKRSLHNDPQITTPITVEPTQINEQTNEVTFSVTTHDNENFSLDIVIQD